MKQRHITAFLRLNLDHCNYSAPSAREDRLRRLAYEGEHERFEEIVALFA
jgi:hypothetical protein